MILYIIIVLVIIAIYYFFFYSKKEEENENKEKSKPSGGSIILSDSSTKTAEETSKKETNVELKTDIIITEAKGIFDDVYNTLSEPYENKPSLEYAKELNATMKTLGELLETKHTEVPKDTLIKYLKQFYDTYSKRFMSILEEEPEDEQLSVPESDILDFIENYEPLVYILRLHKDQIMGRVFEEHLENIRPYTAEHTDKITELINKKRELYGEDLIIIEEEDEEDDSEF